LSSSDLSCPKQARGPGCALGARPYAEGLALKAEGFRAAFDPYAELAFELLPARAAAPTLAYRLRAKLVSSGVQLGLYERGSHRVVDVAGCRVLSPAVAAASEAVRRLLPLPIYGADLRETSEGVLVTLLSEAPEARAELERASRELVARGDVLSAALSLRRKGDVRLLAAEPELIAGPRSARHTLTPEAPYAYAAHGGFVQAHAAQASHVYDELARGLIERLGPLRELRLLELFAGSGSLALALAQRGAKVTAVEAYAPAIALAERAAREQGLPLRAVAADATRFARALLPGSFDAVLVNPPRRGLSVELRAAIGRAAPRVLSYVSCNPHTLARDAWHLGRLGLRLTRAEPLDMIPWSDAVEALAWLEPAAPPVPGVLFEDDTCFALEKAPYESANELLARAGRAATPLDAWGRGTSGVCWFLKPGGGAAAHAPGERTLQVVVRGVLRKQGTVTRRGLAGAPPGSRYRKLRELGRHTLTSVITRDRDEAGTLADFSGIRHPLLGDAAADAPTNEFMLHRHGLERTFLHCTTSRLRLPSGAEAIASSELAPDLAQVLRSLGSDEPAV
jgi:23S rRNA (uracil1939-C5)-methyltransferase